MNEEKNKKVCLVSISLGMGGVERSVALQSKLLQQAGFEVHIALLNDEIAYDFSGEVLNLGKLKSKEDTLLKRISRLKRLRHYLKDKAIDVVIDHRSKNHYLREVFYKKFVYRGFKTVYVTHSAFEPMYFTERPAAFGRLCDSNVANVGVSEYIETHLLKAKGLSNTHTIYNSWEPNWGQNQGTLPKELEGKRYFLFYGRIDDSVKDLHFLIESFALSNLADEKIYLVFMGDGPDKKALQRHSEKLGIDKQLVWLPFHSHPQAIVSNAHAVCLTSRFEGFPMVLVESLALGTPVISLDIVSGPSEVIQHEKNGLLVTKRETKAYSNAMVELVKNEKLYRTCQSNARASVDHLRPEQIREQWKNLLQHV